MPICPTDCLSFDCHCSVLRGKRVDIEPSTLTVERPAASPCGIVPHGGGAARISMTIAEAAVPSGSSPREKTHADHRRPGSLLRAQSPGSPVDCSACRTARSHRRGHDQGDGLRRRRRRAAGLGLHDVPLGRELRCGCPEGASRPVRRHQAGQRQRSQSRGHDRRLGGDGRYGRHPHHVHAGDLDRRRRSRHQPRAGRCGQARPAGQPDGSWPPAAGRPSSPSAIRTRRW